MAHRTQITLRDDQYRRLLEESKRTGLSLAELIRRSLEQTYGTTSKEERLRVLRESAGIWRGHPETGAEFVDRMRPGMDARLRKLGL